MKKRLQRAEQTGRYASDFYSVRRPIFMLKKLAETPMPIVTTQEMPLRRELTPVILPVNLDEVTDSFYRLRSRAGH